MTSKGASQKALQTSNPGPYQCPQCDKAYERHDYLARHIDSHRNKRSFRCPICQRGFNRRDVLQRHRVLHGGLSPDGELIIKRRKDRLPGASRERNTTPNEPERPSKKQKGDLLLAEGTDPLCSDSAYAFPQLQIPDDAFSTDSGVSFNLPFAPEKNHISDVATNTVTYAKDSHSYDEPEPQENMDTLLISHNSVMELSFDTSPNGCPTFFEHVMLPNLNGVDNGHEIHQPPLNTFDLLPDIDFDFSDSGLFGESFIPDLETIVQKDVLFPMDRNAEDSGENTDSARRRAEAFQRSFWINIPDKNRNGMGDHAGPALADRDLDSAVLSPHTAPMNLTINEKLSSRERDQLFRLIVKNGDDSFSMPEIPAVEYLDILIKIGLAKKLETDPWIHLYTCYSQGPRPELLAALVMAGCICCFSSSVNKTGVILQEIVRMSLRNLSESDPQVLRDLQYLQASMICVEIGFSCGYRRNMQMTEGSVQALGIALRRAGAFDSSSYQPISPCDIPDDNRHELHMAWKEWVKQESLKRLVYHFFCHDIEVAAAMNQPPTTSYAELTLPLPESRELWLAQTPKAWKDAWMAQYRQTRPVLSVRDLLSDPTLLSDFPVYLDAEVATSALLHGILAKIWDVRQQVLLGRHSSLKIPARKQLLLQSRQDDLYSDLQQIQDVIVDAPAVTVLIAEFTTMYLHIDIDALQRFAGKMGEAETRKIYPDLREWSLTQEARVAIWHAGQVFRAVRRVGPYQLRGFDSFAIYYASLTLWVYGLLSCAEKESEEPVSWDTDLSSTILLDGPSSRASEIFISQGRGSPGLTYFSGSGQKAVCNLRQPRLVMRVALQVLDSNFPHLPSNDPVGNPSPPLVANLRSLLHDLGNLP